MCKFQSNSTDLEVLVNGYKNDNVQEDVKLLGILRNKNSDETTNIIHSDKKSFFSFLHCVRCPYSEIFWSVFSRIQTEYGASHSVRMRENTDQENSEYGHSSRSVSVNLQSTGTAEAICVSIKDIVSES